MEDSKQKLEDSSGSVSTEPSDSEMDLEEEGWLKQLEDINLGLKDDPYNYELCTSKIEILKKLGELDELRNAREALSKSYPLSPSLWLSWLKDECALVLCPEEKQQLNLLFERAVKDYASVEVWNEYIQFNLEGPEEDGKVERCRDIFERAVSAVGHHFLKGHVIWNAYREFEFGISKLNEQKSKYLAVCNRQLTIPVRRMEETYSLLKTAITIDEVTEKVHQSARKHVDTFEKFESYLERCSDDASKIKVYMEYIDAVNLVVGLQDCVASLYERAVCECPLAASLWLKYLDFIDENVDPEKFLSVGERATRNYPWALSIWTKYMEIIEAITKNKDKMKEVLESALSYCTAGEVTASLWLKYIEFLRRRISYDSIDQADVDLFFNTTAAAEAHLMQLLPEPNDYILEILMYSARVQAHIDKCMTSARKLWYEIFNRGYGHRLDIWIQYYTLEVRYGDLKFVRKCLEKGFKVVKDFPRAVLELWLNFERDFGDIAAIKRCEVVIATATQSATRVQFKEKRTGESSMTGPKAKKRKVAEVEKPRAKGNVEPKIVHEDVKDSQRVFLSNLAYSVGEDEIRQFLSSCGTIVSINVVKDYKGKSKGFAYVSFDSEDSATQALAKDREPILGRATFVSKCNSKDKSNSKSETATEPPRKKHSDKSKLFVKGLPQSKSVDQVKEIFGKFGVIRDVRLVTFRNGLSKGIAFVDFVDDASASTVVCSTDGLDVDGSKISVSISNPPVKSAPGSSTEGDSATTVRRTQKPFVFLPRALKVAKESPEIQTLQIKEEVKKVPMTNQDFRKLFAKDS